MRGYWAILAKEFAHLRRQRSTLAFALVIPVIQLTIFGYAANTTLDHIPLAVFNLDGRQESRRLIESMENTRTFQIVQSATSYDEFHRALSSGRARAGLLIPADYSARLLRGEQARVQMQIDGSDSQTATATLNTANLLIENLAIQRARGKAEALQAGPTRDERGRVALPIESRPRMLFNPDLHDSNFFVPGLIAIILQFVLSFLTAFSIAREREHGTLEQLFVTPVSGTGLLLGNLTPYALLSLAELLLVLVLMTTLFRVPIAGSLALLLALSALFILTALGLGLMISTLASSQLQAMQYTFLVMLPSVLLSGFVFPRAEMPLPLYILSAALPATYFVDILRGVIVRGADLIDVMPSVFGLSCCAAVILVISVARFRKTID
ncbi:MAG: ABC transporter permease [Planctomycetota bacterium]